MIDKSNVESAVYGFFLEKNVTVAPDSAVLRDGILDSMQILEFLMFIEGQIGSEIDPGVVTVANFDTLEKFIDAVTESFDVRA